MENNALTKFQKLEQENQKKPEYLQALEAELEIILAPENVVNNKVEWLLYRNLFRIRHWRHMKIRKPRIFLGMISFSDYPNFQIYPFLTFADIISCCSPQSDVGRDDRLSFDYNSEDFEDLLGKLPFGFAPDYFWEPQVCGGSVPPYGLNKAPFPTIAGICHTFRGPHVEALANYYDIVTPISPGFSELFSRADTSAKTLDIPVGGNWGSFNLNIFPPPGIERDIDVLLNFSPSELPEYGPYRKLAHELCTNFKDKYSGKFNIAIEFGVNKIDYLESMKKAKVVINACGYNGPYNYRTFEAINCGAVLMQIATDFPVSQSLNDFIQEGVHYIEFSQQDFETKLLDILEDDKKRVQMSIAAYEKVAADLSYESIQHQLVEATQQMSPGDFKAARKDDFTCFMAWMRILATSPVHYRHKRDLFAKMAINSGLEDSDSIRLTLMALPILTKTQHGSSYINDIEFRMMFEHSVIGTIEHLFTLIPEHELKFTDKWFFLCCQAIHASIDIAAIEASLLELQQHKNSILNQASLENLVLFDLDLEDSAFVRLKKRVLDMPYMTYFDDNEKKQALFAEFLESSLRFFHKQAINQLRQGPDGSNDGEFDYRKTQRS